jgi:hypothetical protein
MIPNTQNIVCELYISTAYCSMIFNHKMLYCGWASGGASWVHPSAQAEAAKNFLGFTSPPITLKATLTSACSSTHHDDVNKPLRGSHLRSEYGEDSKTLS